MSRPTDRAAGPPPGWATLALSFALVALYRLEQNLAYALGLSPRALVTLDTFPANAVVQTFAPYLHASGDHLVGTLVWLIPFGYLLERRRGPTDYLGFVVVAGFLTTTLVPVVLVVLGLAPGLGVGGSGVAHALVGREATARFRALAGRRKRSRRQWAILVVAGCGFLLMLVAVLTPSDAGSVAGHATGLLVGVLAGVGERDVSPGTG
jgi:membrane associated rhomboid family serine protease